MTTVSALAVLALLQGSNKAGAEESDADHPTVWVELGGQLERVDAPSERFAPSFLLRTPRPTPETISPVNVGHSPRYSVGEEGKIIVEPRGSLWVFSAGVRYGRSNSALHLHQQTYSTQPLIPTGAYGTPAKWPHAVQFADTKRRDNENHLVVDFQAGRDVGLGMFGGASTLSSILEFALPSSDRMEMSSSETDPDAHPTFFYYGNFKILYGGIYHSNSAAASFKRSFHGLGPSLSWTASAPVVGRPEEGQVSLDWGINVAVLFGRQKAAVHHQTTAVYHKGKYNDIHYPRTTLYRKHPARSESRPIGRRSKYWGFCRSILSLFRRKAQLGISG